ncbi:MAG: hypothetical protein Q7S29_04205 [Candidatus Peribacter sp.]|nr:hypothetical protein [Candidatus Peribacter sp.]
MEEATPAEDATLDAGDASTSVKELLEPETPLVTATSTFIWYPAYELMPYAFDEGMVHAYVPAEARTEFPGAICNDLFPLGEVRFITIPTFASPGNPVAVHVMFFVSPTFQVSPPTGAVTAMD